MATIEQIMLLFKGTDEVTPVTDKIRSKISGLGTTFKKSTNDEFMPAVNQIQGGMFGTGKQFGDFTEKVDEGMTKSTKSTEQFTKGIGLMNAAFASQMIGSQLKSFGEDCLDAAVTSETGWNQYQAALETAHKKSGKSIEDIKKDIKGLAEDTHRSLGDTRDVMTNFLVKNLSNADAELATKVSSGIAAQLPKFQGNMVSASNAIIQAMNGNAKSIKALGINMDDYKNKATGQINVHKMLTDLYAKTKNAQNKYSKSMGAATTDMKRQTDSLKVSLGTALLPLLQQLVPFLTKIVSLFNSAPGPVKTLVAGILGVGVVIGSLLPPIMMLTSLKSLLPNIGTEDMGKIDKIKYAFTKLKNTITNAPKTISSAFTSIKTGLSSIGESISNMGQSITSKFKSAFSKIGEAVSNARTTIASSISKIKSLFSSIGESISNMGQNAASKFKSAFSKIGEAVSNARTTIASNVSKIKSLFSNIGEGISDLGSKAVTAAGKLKDMGTAALTAGYNALKAAGMWLVEKIQIVATSIAEGVMTAAQWLLNIAMDANPIGIIILALAGLVAVLVLLYQHCTPFREFINWLGGALYGVAKTIYNSLMNALKTVISWAKNVYDTIVGTVKEIPQRIYDFFMSIPDKIKSAISGAVSAVTQLGSAIWNALKSALHLDWIESVFGSVAQFFGFGGAGGGDDNGSSANRTNEVTNTVNTSSTVVTKNLTQHINSSTIGGTSKINPNLANALKTSTTPAPTPNNNLQSVNINVGADAVKLDARNLTTKESKQVMINALEGLNGIKSINTGGA